MCLCLFTCVCVVQADAESNLRKARHLYISRCEEYERARTAANRVEEEQSGTGSSSTTKVLDKKRRLEEEARNKVSALRQEMTQT